MSVRIGSCLVLVIAIGPSAAQAADTCSLKGTAGTYMVRCTGFNVISPGTNVPVDVLVLQERQKDGEITGKGTVTIGVPTPGGGTTTVAPTEISGTAQINSDCTGTEDLVQKIGGGDPTPAHFNFIAGIKRIDGINTDPGYVLMCTDIRID